MDPPKITSLLLEWFKKHKRPLPWRSSKDPYGIWVSEIMLQQTQVNTVIPYYHRWMKQFPTVAILARAPLGHVLKVWEGLGYYSRARNLHRSARLVVKEWGGRLPERAEALRKLPGIGRYTSGAIASIAFNQPEPVLDGNVKRVLARIFALREPIDQTKGEEKLWGIAQALVETSNCPGDLNQSLMELGALVCLPENPNCPLCPVSRLCHAHRLKEEMNFPVKARREKTQKLKTVAAVIWKNGRVLLEKQPFRARWGGLWMFPQWMHTNGRRETAFLAGKVKRELGITVDKFRPKTEIKHGFTKYRVRLRVYEGEVDRSVIAPRGLSGIASPRRFTAGLAMTRWLGPKDLSRLPLPSPHQKIAELIQNHA